METSSIKKLNQLFDEKNQLWLNEFKVRTLDGRLIKVAVPREEQDPKAVYKQLLKRGAALPTWPKPEADIVAAISADAPIVHLAGRTGWHDNRRVFVSHRHVAGKLRGANGVIPPADAAQGSAGNVEVRGDLATWQRAVSVGIHSTSIMIALSAAFAAPLLSLMMRPNFGLVFVGPTRSGKSTAQLAGASAIGFGTEEDLPSLNATPAGLLSAALAFNDHLLPINEIGTARGPKRDIYDVIRESTYALMNGQEVMRYAGWPGGDAAARNSFKILVLLSSEHSPDAWAARNGERRDEGETARLIGLPILFNNQETIFDRPPKRLNDVALRQWVHQRFGELRKTLPLQRGVAFREYLEAIVRDPKTIRRRARRLGAYFERKVATETMSRIELDIVSKFGVLFAGGLIAVEAGILPFHKRKLSRAVRRACLAAIKALPDPQADIHADLIVLKGKLSVGSIIDVENSTQKLLRLMQNGDGYHQTRETGRVFVVRAQVFTHWFTSQVRTRAVLEWLSDEGFLCSSRPRTEGRSLEWAQTQAKWPNGIRVRSIELYFPNGVTDLDRSA